VINNITNIEELDRETINYNYILEYNISNNKETIDILLLNNNSYNFINK